MYTAILALLDRSGESCKGKSAVEFSILVLADAIILNLNERVLPSLGLAGFAEKRGLATLSLTRREPDVVRSWIRGSAMPGI